MSPARTEGRAVEAPYTAVHAAEVGSVMQLLRLEHVASEHFPRDANGLYNHSMKVLDNLAISKYDLT